MGFAWINRPGYAAGQWQREAAGSVIVFGCLLLTVLSDGALIVGQVVSSSATPVQQIDNYGSSCHIFLPKGQYQIILRTTGATEILR